MKTIFITLLLVFSQTVFAGVRRISVKPFAHIQAPASHATVSTDSRNLIGTWSGAGVYSDNDGYSQDCDTAVTITNDGSTFVYTLVLGGDCDWEENISFSVKGEELWSGDTKVGTITDKSIQFTEISDVTYDVNMDLKSESTAAFKDHMDYGDGYEDSVAGTLARVK